MQSRGYIGLLSSTQQPRWLIISSIGNGYKTLLRPRNGRQLWRYVVVIHGYNCNPTVGKRGRGIRSSWSRERRWQHDGICFSTWKALDCHPELVDGVTVAFEDDASRSRCCCGVLYQVNLRINCDCICEELTHLGIESWGWKHETSIANFWWTGAAN